MFSIEISHRSSVFNEIKIPASDYGKIVGYAALTAHYRLAVPRLGRLSIVSPHNRAAKTPEYQLYSASYLPDETLLSQLTFALKYEGVNLLVLKKFILNSIPLSGACIY